MHLIDRLLPLLILIVMAAGILIGVYSPSTRIALNAHRIVDVSAATTVGLLLMIYPVLCKVRYEALWKVFKTKGVKKNLGVSMTINQIIAPLLMLSLAWLTLPDLPGYRTGVIIVGIARCVAMVILWNELANGDTEWCAILVAVNAILQLFLFSPLTYLFTLIGNQTALSVDFWLVTRSVLIFLGIPMTLAILTRTIFRRCNPRFYDSKFIPLISPLSLIGLLYTILVMFALQGNEIISDIGNVFRIAVPLILYFTIAFFGTLYLCYRMHLTYPIAVTQSFTAAGNNFELAIAVAIASFGIESQQALATVVGPLIEVPILLLFVNVAVALRGRFFEKREEGIQGELDYGTEMQTATL